MFKLARSLLGPFWYLVLSSLSLILENLRPWGNKSRMDLLRFESPSFAFIGNVTVCLRGGACAVWIPSAAAFVGQKRATLLLTTNFTPRSDGGGEGEAAVRKSGV